jgi:hypothetical protein
MSVGNAKIGVRNERKIMSHLLSNVGYVSYDGNYGEQSDLLVFDNDSLTPQQWETLGEIDDNSRYEYVEAIFAGKDLSEWEN